MNHLPIHPKPSVTIRSGKVLKSSALRKVGIKSVTLCEHYLPGCAELIVNHTEKWGRHLYIHTRSSGTNGTLTLSTSKDDKADHMIEITFAHLPGKIAKLLEHGLTYTHMAEEQETILFVPKPRTDAQQAKVGAVIAGTA